MKATPYWIEGPWPGRLAILPRPRGGDWLEDEVRSWREAGIDVVVSTLTPDEAAELELNGEADAAGQVGVEWAAFPIADRGLPDSAEAFGALVRRLGGELKNGRNVAVHCRQGVGRSAVLAAGVLMDAGVAADAAWDRIGAARGCPVPDTAEQRAWVNRFSQARVRAERPAPHFVNAEGS